MEFRKAELADVEFIAGLLSEFYAKSGEVYQIPWDEPSAVQTIENVIRDGVCIVGPSSCAGAMIAPFPFNVKANIASVVFWYFRTPRESSIFDAFAGCCQVAGATHYNPSSHFPMNTIERFYLKRGLEPTEVQYLVSFDSYCKKTEKG
jgi:hypothetical protein